MSHCRRRTFGGGMAMTYPPFGNRMPSSFVRGLNSPCCSQKLYQADSTTLGMYALWKSSFNGFNIFLCPAGVSSTQSLKSVAETSCLLDFLSLRTWPYCCSCSFCCCCACFAFLLANSSSLSRCFSLITFSAARVEDISNAKDKTRKR